jgi:hypothetical protein
MLDPETTQAPEATEPEDDGLEDYDAFWQARTRKRKGVKIGGRTFLLPASVPLQFELEARHAQRSKSEGDVRKLVGILFGADALDHFAASGMDAEQFQVLLRWSVLRMAGQDVTMAQVADQIAAADKGESDADPT